MYCHQCGAKAYGAYCSHCGARIITSDTDPELTPRDWADEIHYELLMRQPAVRDLITRHASQSQKRISANDFLELCDKAFIPLTGVSLAKIGLIVQPIYAAIGIKTGKMHKELFPMSAGKVIVAAICSLARHGQPLNKVEQGEDGCLLKAGVPSDMWSFGGDLLITVQRHERGSSVEAATIIKGQLYDWGKSKGILTELFNDIKTLPV